MIKVLSKSSIVSARNSSAVEVFSSFCGTKKEDYCISPAGLDDRPAASFTCRYIMAVYIPSLQMSINQFRDIFKALRLYAGLGWSDSEVRPDSNTSLTPEEPGECAKGCESQRPGKVN